MQLAAKFDFEKASEAFYQNLFALFPEIEESFTNVHAQKQMFEIALKSVVNNREKGAELKKHITKLGEKHKMMGIQRIHMIRGYQAFHAALLAGCPDMENREIESLTEIYKDLLVAMGFPMKDADLLIENVR